MCHGCYVDYGHPVVINEKVLKVVDLIKKVYKHSLVGGNLHIVTDDWNLEDENVDWCIENFHKTYEDVTDEEYQIEMDCLLLLKELTVPERATALALVDGFIEKGDLQ